MSNVRTLGLFVLSVQCACASGMSARRDLEPPGYIVLGPASASYFGLTSNVRVPEVSFDAVPPDVVNAIESWATGLRYDAQCLRFFPAGNVYVVVAPPICPEHGPQPDDIPIAVFDARGQQVKQSISDYWDDELVISPLRRLRRDER